MTMLNPDECRDRAAAVLALAALSPDTATRTGYEDCAAHWRALAEMPAVHDQIRRNLAGRLSL